MLPASVPAPPHPQDFALVAWGESASDSKQLGMMRDAGLDLSGFCRVEDLAEERLARRVTQVADVLIDQCRRRAAACKHNTFGRQHEDVQVAVDELTLAAESSERGVFFVLVVLDGFVQQALSALLFARDGVIFGDRAQRREHQYQGHVTQEP
jgi:hypothetical protein